MEKLASKNCDRVIDLLNERLTFERAGVKLYDTVLRRLRARADKRSHKLAAILGKNREEEKEHEEWLEEQLRLLGEDAHSLSERSILVMAESEGIERVIRRDENIGHELHALLAAELTDNAGWDLLVQLAAEVGDRKAKRAFKKRLRDEEKHLLVVRKALLELTKEEVLAPPPEPLSP